MALYSAILKFFDGSSITIPIDGVRANNGLILVPESVTLSSGQFFTLNKKIKVIDYFEYREKVPFREDLH